jgi:hypothetical protein
MTDRSVNREFPVLKAASFDSAVSYQVVAKVFQTKYKFLSRIGPVDQNINETHTRITLILQEIIQLRTSFQGGLLAFCETGKVPSSLIMLF